MKAPTLSANELAKINRVRRKEQLALPHLYLPPFFDAGRIAPYKDSAEEYQDIDWVVGAMIEGEVLTAVNSNGDMVYKFFMCGSGVVHKRDVLRCELAPSKRNQP